MQIEAGLDTGPVFACDRVADRCRRHQRDRSATARRAAAPRCSSSTSRTSRPRPRRRRSVSRRTPTSSRSTSSASIPRVRRSSSIASCGPAIPSPARGSAPRAARYKVFGPTTATERVHALGVVGAAGIGTADGTLQPARDPARGQTPHGVGRLAARPPGRSRDRRVSAAVRPRALALDALVRIEDGAFAHILVPGAAAPITARAARPRPRHRARVRHGPDAARARLPARQGVEAGDRRSRARGARRDPARRLPAAPRHPVARGSRRDGGSRGLPSARLRERRAARARAHRAAVVVARRTTRSPTSAYAPRIPTGSSACSSTTYGAADAIATLALADEAAAGDAPSEPDAGHRERRRARAARRRHRCHARRARPRRVGVARRAATSASLAPVREGRATPQDQASQAVVAVLDPQPGERVLDLAAAPGGKSGAIAERMRDEGLVVAADVNAGRMRLLARSADRLSLHAIAPVVGDGRVPPVRAAVVRSCAPRRAVQRPRRAAAPSGCAVADPTERRPRPRRAAAGADRRGRRDRCGRAGGSCTRCAPSARRRRCRSTSSRRPRSRTSPHSARPPAPWRRHGRGALLLPSDARTDGMFVLVLERTGAPRAPST